MPVNSEIFRIYRHLFYGSPLKISTKNIGINDREFSIERYGPPRRNIFIAPYIERQLLVIYTVVAFFFT